MRLVISVLAAVAVATPAFALLPPEYYKKARDEAAHVVVFKVEKVEGTRPADGHGECTVTGKVEAVERGAHYRVGGPIAVQVPCVWPDAPARTSGVIYHTMADLKGATRARAWMTAPGVLALYQYERLS